MTSVSVVGLGKLGVCMAACFAYKGLPVVGVDINPGTVYFVNEGQPPIWEPGLEELMQASRGRLRATSTYQEAINETDATFVVVPTPSEADGRFSLKYVKSAAEKIGQALAEKSGYHLVVITSTVLPGSTGYGVLPVLEQASGKRCPQDFGLCYSPQFISLGNVIKEFLNPDFALIGESDQRAGDELASIYQQLRDDAPPIARMNFVNSEMTKIAVNTYVTMKITFANMLAAMCQELPGGDVDVVTSALGLDGRIGQRYLKGALGYGGPCFPRDNLALSFLARQLGQEATLAEATHAFNQTIVARLVDRIVSCLPDGGTVAVLGLAYKPDTDVVEESQGLQIAQCLMARGVNVVVYDSLARETAHCALGEGVRYSDSVDDCLSQANVVVIANPDREFGAIDVGKLGCEKKPVIVDAWRVLTQQFLNGDLAEYHPVGVGLNSFGSEARLREMWSHEASG